MRLVSSLGLIGVMEGAKARLEAAAGSPLEPSYNPTQIVLSEIAAGRKADVAILSAAGIDTLIAQGLIDKASRRDLARSLVGIAVKAGAAKPDISTVEAVKLTLTQARSVVYSRKGQSGIFFAGLIARLGIADAVNARAVIVESGTTAELVAEGKAEIAVQQVSELMIVPGIDVVGPLPDEIQDDLVFTAGAFIDAADRLAAGRLIDALSDPSLAALYLETGLQPVNRR